MKKLFNTTSAILTVLLIAGFIVLFNSRVYFDRTKDLGPIDNDKKKIAVGKELVLKFDDALVSLEELSDAEQQEQVRDWLMLGLADIYAGSADQFTKIVFDKSATRDGYVNDIANLEFGALRSFVTNDQNVVALIPVFNSKGDSIDTDERLDHLAHIADGQRKNLGHVPERIVPFSYEINMEESYAIIRADQEIQGKSLFTSESGYTEMELTDLATLNNFLSKVEDLTFIHKTLDNTIRAGGRKRRSSPYRGVTESHIAALWQSMVRIKEFKARLDSFDMTWRMKRYNTEDERKILEEQRVNDYSLLLQSFAPYGNYTGDSGFSLDPVYDYEKIANSLINSKPLTLKLIEEKGLDISESDIDQAYQSLVEHDPEKVSGMKLVPLFGIIDKLKKSGSDYAVLLGEVWEETIQMSQYQKARYDGYLRGTEVGMVLFYTDLVAKLWTIDFEKQSPNHRAVDFINGVNCKWSPIFDQERKELPAARLWFGFNNDGFQVAENELLFARNATRIYAASNNPNEPGVEKPTAARFAIPLNWWNNYFEEVAEYEKEYQRLNEIMKWSLIIGWMEKNDDTSLSFLNDVHVNRSIWFPEWARSNRQLKFNSWNSVNFYNKGFKNQQEEVLPILYGTKSDHGSVLSGGVSLAGRSTFNTRLLLLKDFNPLLKRSNLIYSTEGLGRELETLNGIKYSFEEVSTLDKVITSTPAKDAMLRSTNSQLRNEEFVRNISKVNNGTSIKTKYAFSEMNECRILRGKESFIEVEVIPKDVDAARSLARNMSASFAPELEIMEGKFGVVSAIRTGDDQFLVRFEGSSDWVKIQPETRPSREIEAGWFARVSDVNNGKINYNLKFVKPTEVIPELGDGDQLVLLTANDRTTFWEMRSKSNTEGIQKLELKVDNSTVEGWVNKQTREIIINAKTLPQSIKGDLGRLQTLITKEHQEHILELANKGGTVKYDQFSLSSGNEAIVKIQNAQYDEVITMMKENPESLISDLQKYEKTKLDKVNFYLKNKDVAKAKLEFNQLVIDLEVESSPMKIANQEIETVAQWKRVNLRNRESVLLHIEENSEGFIASDGLAFEKQYAINEHALMLNDLKLHYPGRKNYYFDIKGQNEIKEKAWLTNTKLNAEGDLNIKQLVKDSPELKPKDYFESAFKVHDDALKSNFSPIIEEEGTAITTLTQDVRIRGVFSNIRMKITARTSKMLKAFQSSYESLRSAPWFKSKRLSDLVNSAKSDMRKSYPSLSDEEFRTELMGEFNASMFVDLWIDEEYVKTMIAA